jgi:hypothetical protein
MSSCQRADEDTEGKENESLLSQPLRMAKPPCGDIKANLAHDLVIKEHSYAPDLA